MSFGSLVYGGSRIKLIRNDDHSDFQLVPIEPRDDRRAAPAPVEFVDLQSQSPLPALGDPHLPTIQSTYSRTASTPQHRSSSDTPEQESGKTWRIETSRGPLWLQGDSILCACPDCGAPMSVRLWLLLAQCWQCGTQIELDAEQQEAIESLLAQRTASLRQTESSPSHPGPRPTPAGPSRTPAARTPGARTLTSPAPESTGTSSQAAARLVAPAERTRRAAPPGTRYFSYQRRKGNPRRATPAWLVSLVLHFVLLLILALLAISDYVEVDSITLTSFISPADREGGIIVEPTDDDPIEFELPVPADVDVSDEEERAELEKASEEAKEIREDLNPAVELPDVDLVRERLTADTSDRSHFIARDPRLRVEVVRKEGGSTLTEAAVARGLSWLARHQNRDGSWSLDDFEDSHRASNEGDAAATALALLPFLGAGQTHEYGRYKETVSAGLLWLLSRQAEDGDMRAGMVSQMGMYAHGQATIVLVEALALSGDERFRVPAQRAINFIVEAQHEQGGWRYRPGQAGDTSVLGWQLMALQSARSPGLGLEVPETALQLASYYLDLSSSAEGSLYAYQPTQKNRPTETMTVEALLCRMYLGWTRDDPRLYAGLHWCFEREMPNRRDKNVYYWYYATQAFHNYGGEMWEAWNREMQDVLVESQLTRGRHAGSWSPDGFEYGDVGGRIYVTALSVCTLEVYYRHLPIFRRIEL